MQTQRQRLLLTAVAAAAVAVHPQGVPKFQRYVYGSLLGESECYQHCGCVVDVAWCLSYQRRWMPRHAQKHQGQSNLDCSEVLQKVIETEWLELTLALEQNPVVKMAVVLER